MAIPVEVPGLDNLIPELRDGQVILVESGADSAKSFFVRRLGLTSLRLGKPVTFLISRDRQELYQLMKREGGASIPQYDERLEVREETALPELDGVAERKGLLAIDSFSFLTLDLTPARMAEVLRDLRGKCQRSGTTVVLATDRGMFDPRAEAIAIHLADGFLQFQAREGSEGVVRYLRIPKWSEGKFFDRNIYYEFDGARLAIDLRNRVL